MIKKDKAKGAQEEFKELGAHVKHRAKQRPKKKIRWEANNTAEYKAKVSSNIMALSARHNYQRSSSH